MKLEKPPTSTRPQEAQIFVRMAESGGRAVERKLVLPVAPATALIGIKPLFGDKSVAEGDKADFDVVFVAPDGKQLPRDGLRYELLKMELRYQWYRQNSSWEYEPVKSTSRVADGDLDLAADKPSRLTFCAAARPLPARRQIGRRSTGRSPRCSSMSAGIPTAAPTRRTCWRPRSTSRNTRPATPWWCRSMRARPASSPSTCSATAC